jgi:hypothetical protein
VSKTYKQPRQRAKVARVTKRTTTRRTRHEVRRSCFIIEEGTWDSLAESAYEYHNPSREGKVS